MCTIFPVIMKTLNMINLMIFNILCLIEDAFVMMCQNIFNSISFCCQICSLLPVCCVFIITSKLRCFLNGSAGTSYLSNEIGFSCIVMTILTLIVLLYYLSATESLDKIFEKVGYIHQSKVK